MSGMGLPLGQLISPPGPPAPVGGGGGLGVDPSLAGMMPPPPQGMPGMDPGMDQGGMLPPGPGGYPSTDPSSLAGIIAQAIAQAQSADQDELHASQHAAAQGAMAHPIVQSMLGLSPQPMRGMSGDAASMSAPMDPASMLGGQ